MKLGSVSFVITLATLVVVPTTVAQGFLYSADQGNIVVWNEATSTKTEVEACSATKLITAMVLSPDKSRLFTGCDDSTLKMWDASTNTLDLLRTMTGHTAGISALAVSPDGKFLLSGDSASQDPQIKKWDVESGAQQFSITNRVNEPVRALAVSSDNKFIFSNGEGNTVAQWDATSHEFTRDLPDASAPVNKMIGSSRGIILYASDTAVVAADEADGTLKQEKDIDDTTAMLLSADEAYLYLGSNNGGSGSVTKYDAVTLDNIDDVYTNDDHGVTALEVSTSLDNIYIGLDDGTILLRNTVDKTDVSPLKLSHSVVSIVFAPPPATTTTETTTTTTETTTTTTETTTTTTAPTTTTTAPTTTTTEPTTTTTAPTTTTTAPTTTTTAATTAPGTTTTDLTTSTLATTAITGTTNMTPGATAAPPTTAPIPTDAVPTVILSATMRLTSNTPFDEFVNVSSPLYNQTVDALQGDVAFAVNVSRSWVDVGPLTLGSLVVPFRVTAPSAEAASSVGSTVSDAVSRINVSSIPTFSQLFTNVTNATDLAVSSVVITPTPSTGLFGGLSSGAIAGIVIGVIAFVIIVVAVVGVVCTRGTKIHASDTTRM